MGDKACGRSSVVERYLAKVEVEGSSPFARFVCSLPLQQREAAVVLVLNYL